MRASSETPELTLEDMVAKFRDEYRKNFPPGGDEGDHYEATRCGVEAVLMAAPAYWASQAVRQEAA